MSPRSYKATLPLALSFLLLFTCAASATWLSFQQRRADGWIRHTLEVENQLSRIQVLTTRAEINRRGYLLTGSNDSIATYNRMRGSLAQPLAGLMRAVADNAPQEARAQALRAVIFAKLDEMRRSIILYRGGKQADAIAIVASDESRLRTKQLLALTEAMRGEEEELLAARTARSDRLEIYAVIAFAFSGALFLLLALLVGLDRRRRLVALAEANAELEQDIDVRKALEKDLDAARVRAESAAAAKASFLANMSHEIRTPMNGVVGFTELLLASDLSPEQRRQTELIADSGRAMMRLLNDILDLSKVDAGLMKVATEPFDLHHTLRACTKLMAPAIHQRGVAFRCDIAEDLPKIIVGDGLRLRQIVLNLLGNASKFTLEGEIRFDVRKIERAGRTLIEIDVADTGIGIAPEHQATIFDQFVQADTAIAPRFGGTGLGLAISAQLARLMGGNLILESEVGQGSLFRVTLPIVLPVATAFDPPPLAVEMSPETVAAPLAPLRLLVAEDHDVNQLLILAMLDQLGIKADLAADGGQAVDMVERAAAAGAPYALVLMDMQMPGMDGVEAALQLRAKGFGPAMLPILALTANAYADDIATCLNAGMQAHLSKPIQSSDLESAIRRWTARPTAQNKLKGADRFSPNLRERYRVRRVEMIDLIATLAQLDRVSDEEIARLTETLHKFVGSAEMFGDHALSDQARALEQELGTCARAERSLSLRRAIEAVRSAA